MSCIVPAALLALVTALSLSAQEPLQGEAYQAVEAAYALQRAGRLGEALAKADEALGLAPRNAQLQGLKLNLLLQAGRLDTADRWLQGMLRDWGPSGPLLLQQAMLQQRLGKFSQAAAAAEGALATGGLDEGQVRLARLTLCDVELAVRNYSGAQAALQPLINDPSWSIQSRLGYALMGAQRPAEAARVFLTQLDSLRAPEDRRQAAAALRDAAVKAGDLDLEIQALKAQAELAPSDAAVRQDLGRALARQGRVREGYETFRASLGAGSSAPQWFDAAYLAKRAGLNEPAAADFKAGLEKDPDWGNAAARFGLRREVETLERRWGAVLSSTYRVGGLIPGQNLNQRVLQQGAEVYYQPESLMRDGRMVQVFVQGFETLWTAGQGTTGKDTIQGSWGVRAKPLSDENLVLTVQRLFKGGRLATQDWMYRAGYSTEGGTDLRPGSSSWTTWSLFAEAASFSSTGQFVHDLEGRWGRSFLLDRVSPRLVLMPHLVVGEDYDSRAPQGFAAGIGLGCMARYWFRETAVRAPASWVELSVQYRARASAADREQGTFIRATVWF
jgi:tetratricopeptide (TPR) repeat protein